eukprot:CAMPEP_0115860176 /NCGR_PEP_ID=MMETSP0287-20121206/16990_1 /TAXON_ID=412157 /ORGANISM="Chrysochromulina rotalis, Strain UIO044" /LENGTH=86 /DNA_ID=CAMNT_0003314487 /DNA_START=578 /DNA_END=838 /DNA_ORIENTATION=-
MPQAHPPGVTGWSHDGGRGKTCRGAPSAMRAMSSAAAAKDQLPREQDTPAKLLTCTGPEHEAASRIGYRSRRVTCLSSPRLKLWID